MKYNKVSLFIMHDRIAFGLHGKIVFYDGTYVIGKVTKVDESSVYIIPVGLDTPQGILVGNIDSLNMENGMVPVLNSNVEYFYQGGAFTPNNDDWMADASQKVMNTLILKKNFRLSMILKNLGIILTFH